MIKNDKVKLGYQKIISMGNTTIISKDCRIVGNISGNCDITVAGEVYGDVTTERSVITEENSIIRGDIKSKGAFIKGEVRGSIRVDGNLIIGDTARVEGDIEYRSMSIEKGAFFSGKSSVIDEDSKKE